MRDNRYPKTAASPTPLSLIWRLIFLPACLALAACVEEPGVMAVPAVQVGNAPDTHAEFARQLEEVGLSRTAMGKRWLEAAGQALTEPVEIVPPHAESGGFLAHRAGAVGLTFEALDGQRLRLNFNRRGNQDGRVFVDLFFVPDPLADDGHVRLGGLPPDASTLEMVLPHDGRYIVRLQPELLIDSLYNLRIELDASMPFPVQIEPNAVGSFFGDPRDAGARLHEGIDIFAPRHTPVLAVAAGRASTRTTPRGGRVVWLRARGQSYYYAHLEKAAFTGSRKVEAGEVLGYVGNSGNAITTPPHLHFGVYRRGHGAMDPLPRLAARMFEEAPMPVDFLPHYVRTYAGKLNLRAAPDTASEVLHRLDAGTILRTSAIRGEWLRVRTAANVSGWIHADYQEEAAAVGNWSPVAPTVLLDSLGPHARPVAVVPAEDELQVIGSHATHLLVRSPDGQAEGWVAGPLPLSVDDTTVAAAGDGAAGGIASGAYD